MFRNLLTAKQVVVVYGFAGVTKDRLPKRFGQVSVFPSPLDPKVSFQIRKTSFVATYGGKLFEVIHNIEAQLGSGELYLEAAQ
jgi:hypothetical protein